jgi:hypothetical protein
MGVLGDFSTLVASVVAIYGINAWRREFIGKRRADLAEETLSLFYMASDAVAHMRSPFAGAEEGRSRKEEENESPEEKETKDLMYVVNERYQKHSETFAKLRSVRYLFMARFGKDKERYFQEFDRIVTEILAHAQLMGYYLSKEPNRRTPEEIKQIRESERIIWPGLPGQDPTKERIEKVLSEMDVFCRGVINTKFFASKVQDFYQAMLDLMRMIKQK